MMKPQFKRVDVYLCLLIIHQEISQQQEDHRVLDYQQVFLFSHSFKDWL